ncbi:MAG: DUF4160 domain-containing protein [Oscillospiraceae bacterium]|jgi:hypothetical protein|nr:DUF4160 domain-containing protein [Oscillospiraceae bacterium]
MPKVLQDFLGLVFFFWSNEFSGNRTEPVHIHVSKGKQTANATKFWILPNGDIELAHNGSDLTAAELKKAAEYIKANRSTILTAWYNFFESL